MRLQNNIQESNINPLNPVELSTLEEECRSPDYSVLLFPESTNLTKNAEEHLPLFYYIVEASETAMEFISNILGQFEVPLDVLRPDTRYVIYDLTEDCKILDLSFYELINSLNIHLKDCIRLENLTSLEDMVGIVFDFIDTQSIFLEKSLSTFEKFKLDKLQLRVIPLNEFEEKEEEKTSFYENDSHQLEDFLLNYIMDIGVLVSDMVRELKLKSFLDEFKTIERFKKITEIDYRNLELKIKRSKQNAKSVMGEAKLKHTGKFLRIEEEKKFEDKNQVNEFVIEQSDYIKKVKGPQENKNKVANVSSIKHPNENFNFTMSTNHLPINRLEAMSFSINNASIRTLADEGAQEKVNLVIFSTVFGVLILIAFLFWCFYCCTKCFKKKKYRKLVSQNSEVLRYY
ncbi:hypothetical protein NBO_92g0005 [Nosema bombycis CQ1]|uniref:Uncharacterized protein n=1 Tax=Nosema bombycis (strain CQ1 / CVCC 102059) TaxID=578461 RepID=R0KSQ8_NOSB1|nr:hypothetical protein NBO_92g0005 [Nosema bombycis CQ1]|eukprot:EOB13252.1 hypothetical protein NBO_92g0005 [Nosema bombycis CQ1]